MTTQVRNSELVDLLRADFVNCWIPVRQAVLAAPAAAVTFANLPQNYRALALFTQARTDRPAEIDNLNWRANGDAGARYDRSWIQRYGAALTSGEARAATQAYGGLAEAANSRANCFAPTIIFWPDYSRSDREHYSLSFSCIVGDLSADGDLGLTFRGSHWRPAVLAAITSLTLRPETGPNFVAGSRFALYGIL